MKPGITPKGQHPEYKQGYKDCKEDLRALLKGAYITNKHYGITQREYDNLRKQPIEEAIKNAFKIGYLNNRKELLAELDGD